MKENNETIKPTYSEYLIYKINYYIYYLKMCFKILTFNFRRMSDTMFRALVLELAVIALPFNIFSGSVEGFPIKKNL